MTTSTKPDLASIGARLEKRLQFELACKELARAVAEGQVDILPLAKRAHTLLKARHTSVGAWRAGLELFESLGGSEAEAWAKEARAFLHEEEGGGDEGGTAAAGGAAGTAPTSLAEALYGREAAEEMRRRRAAANPVMTDAGFVEPPAPVAAAARPAAAAADDDGDGEATTATATAPADGLGEARRLLMEQLQAAVALEEGAGEGAEEDREHQQRLLAALMAAFGGNANANDEDDDDLQAALLASRLEAPEQPAARPPASRRVLAALPTRTVTAADEKTTANAPSSSPRCPICCERWQPGDVVQRLLPGCGHEFHRDCLAPWLGKRSNACPLCRLELPTDDHAYEAKKEREQEAAEERKGAENAAKGGEFIYM
jgi:hypothetical protein